MKNKKGFTLVEIVIVIALLGLLMLLVVPNVVDKFANAKRNIFYNDVVNLYSQATSTYISRSADDFATSPVFTHNGNPLDIEGADDLEYYIKVNSYGQVIYMAVSSSDFHFSIEDSNIAKSDIKKSDIESGHVTPTPPQQ